MNVMTPSPLTAMLADHMVIKPGSIVADIGCGSGVLALKAAELGASLVYAVDINRDAIDATAANATAAGLRGRIRTIHGSAAELPRIIGQELDTIVANPPQLPFRDGPRASATTGLAKAYAGGNNGRDVIDCIIDTAPLLLLERQTSSLQLVTSSVVSLQKTHERLSARGFRIEIAGSRRAQFRRPYFESMDLIPRETYTLVDGMPHEELQVIRAWRT